jgi:hypothetical protein
VLRPSTCKVITPVSPLCWFLELNPVLTPWAGKRVAYNRNSWDAGSWEARGFALKGQGRYRHAMQEYNRPAYHNYKRARLWYRYWLLDLINTQHDQEYAHTALELRNLPLPRVLSCLGPEILLYGLAINKPD